jgi:hypothetical protein
MPHVVPHLLPLTLLLLPGSVLAGLCRVTNAATGSSYAPTLPQQQAAAAAASLGILGAVAGSSRHASSRMEQQHPGPQHMYTGTCQWQRQQWTGGWAGNPAGVAAQQQGGNKHSAAVRGTHIPAMTQQQACGVQPCQGFSSWESCQQLESSWVVHGSRSRVQRGLSAATTCTPQHQPAQHMQLPTWNTPSHTGTRVSSSWVLCQQQQGATSSYTSRAHEPAQLQHAPVVGAAAGVRGYLGSFERWEGS